MNDPSSVLPSDPDDRMRQQLLGLPNGAHTHPAAIQVSDFYGNAAQFMVQTIRWDDGCTVFITKMDAAGGKRFTLPPRVIGLIERQIQATSSMVKRRHGKRLAEQRKAAGLVSTITPAMRLKAAAARKLKAAQRKARRRKP